jgi:hypothetical protein
MKNTREQIDQLTDELVAYARSRTPSQLEAIQKLPGGRDPELRQRIMDGVKNLGSDDDDFDEEEAVLNARIAHDEERIDEEES